MGLANLPQIVRNANRWREVLAILSKHGLADWIGRIEAPLAGGWIKRPATNGEHSRVRREERVRLALEELGPAFIKLGQVLATRPDVVGIELADELAKLQNSTPATPPDQVVSILSEELGRPVEELFAEFDSEPIASASIGQVHRGVLTDGAKVAVKVRHPGVEKQLRGDLEILLGLAELAERIPDLRPYRPLAIAREFERTLKHEVDFRDEMRRLQQFFEAYETDPRVCTPRPYPDYCGERVLTQQWLDGVWVSSSELHEQPNELLVAAARNGAEIYLDMIFELGMYHADPHPGNLVILPEGVVGIVDFGMVGRVTDSLREDLEDVLMAVAADDPGQLVNALLRIGSAPQLLDEEQFTAEIVDFVDHFGHQSVGKFDLRGALTELFRIVREHGITLPAQLSMLLKLLVMLEGTARRLQPDFSLIEVLAPLQRRMILRRLSPSRQAKRARRLYGEAGQLAEELPRRLRDLLNQFQSGRFEVHLDHQGLEPSVNRLVLGLLTSSLIVSGSLLVSREVMTFQGVSVPGVLAFLMSGLLGLRLLRAISKSGWLDSH